MKMTTTLTGGTLVTLSFKHLYDIKITPAYDSRGNLLPRVNKTPTFTTARLIDRETGKTYASASVAKDPKDRPSKEMARQYALAKLYKELNNETDVQRVKKAYKDRNLGNYIDNAAIQKRIQRAAARRMANGTFALE